MVLIVLIVVVVIGGVLIVTRVVTCNSLAHIQAIFTLLLFDYFNDRARLLLWLTS